MAMLSLNRPSAPGAWLVRLATALLWAVAAASLAYWLSRLTGPGASATVPAVPAQRQAPSDGPAHQAALGRMLGALPQAALAQASPGAERRFALLGVIASRAGHGAALIAVDGEPARPLRLGAQVAPGYWLATLSRREVVLQDNARPPATIVLRLPALETDGAALSSPQDALAEPAAIRSAPEITSSGVSTPALSPAATPTPAPLPAAPGADGGPPPRLDPRYPAAGARR